MLYNNHFLKGIENSFKTPGTIFEHLKVRAKYENKYHFFFVKRKKKSTKSEFLVWVFLFFKGRYWHILKWNEWYISFENKPGLSWSVFLIFFFLLFFFEDSFEQKSYLKTRFTIASGHYQSMQFSFKFHFETNVLWQELKKFWRFFCLFFRCWAVF